MEATLNIQKLSTTTIFSFLISTSRFVFAADSPNTHEVNQAKNQTQMYGSQLMSEQEKIEQRSRMRAAKTIEEREQIRKENHERMGKRAKKQGGTLPNELPSQGHRMGFGNNHNPNRSSMGAARSRGR